MDHRKEQRLARAGMAASVAAAFGASLCCIGPIVAAMFGVTSLAALVKYEPLRPLFSAMTVVMLAAAFYMTYRKRTAQACAPGSVCATQGVDRVQRINRVALWIASTLALIVLTFPTWSTWVPG
jgi:mercuric ion transport protein